MNLHFHAQLTAKDYFDAQMLNGRKRAYLVYAIQMALFSSFVGLVLAIVTQPILGIFASVGGFAASLIAGLWTIPRSIAKRTKKIFAQQKSLQVPVEVWISDTELHLKSASAEVHSQWNNFHKWKANDKIIMIYLSDITFHTFPRRWFASDEDFNSFKAFLTQTIGPAGKARNSA